MAFRVAELSAETGLVHQQRLPSYIQLQIVGFRGGHKRTASKCEAEPGKGFGANRGTKIAPRKDKPAKTIRTARDGDEAVQKALKLFERSKSTPIDDKQAAAGRIDYAKVKNWGTGKPADLGSLQLESFIPGSQAGTKQKPLYVELTYATVQAMEQGIIDEYVTKKLPVPGKKVLPDFHEWSLSKERYVQYLVNQQAVHHSLESSVAEALAVGQGVEEAAGIPAALECFSEAKGLDRSLEIAADLTNLDSAERDSGAGHPSTNPGAASYVEYLRRLGNECAEATDASPRGSACLRLIAHVYANHLQLLTGGSRMGAAAAEKLNLFSKHAVNLYRTYPFEVIGKDPLKALQKNVNEAGNYLGEEERRVIVDELPCAMAFTMQLLQTLAATD